MLAKGSREFRISASAFWLYPEERVAVLPGAGGFMAPAPERRTAHPTPPITQASRTTLAQFSFVYYRFTIVKYSLTTYYCVVAPLVYHFYWHYNLLSLRREMYSWNIKITLFLLSSLSFPLPVIWSGRRGLKTAIYHLNPFFMSHTWARVSSQNESKLRLVY